MTPSFGSLVQSYFIDHLHCTRVCASVQSKLPRHDSACFCVRVRAAAYSIASLTLHDLTFEQVFAFLKHLEQERGNSVHTRNQRRAALNTFFAYLAARAPEMLAACQQVAAIPVKRTSLPDTRYLEREEVTALFRALPRDGRFALRDRTLLFLCPTQGPGCRKSPIFAWSILRSSRRLRFAFTARVISGASVPYGMTR